MARLIKKYDKYIVVFILLLISFVYSFISITLHNKFLTFGLDLGTFDEAIWKISRGIFPYSSSGCNWLLEDHFQVIFYLMAPLFWIWDNVKILLILQSLWMVFSAFPLYVLSKRVTKSILFSFAVIFAYLFFIGTQFAILNEFHQTTFAPMFIALIYLSVEKNSKYLYWFSVLMLFLIKEDMTILVGVIGVGLIFREKWRVRGLVSSFLGFASFFLLTYILMPLLSIKGTYDHFSHFKSIGGATSPLGVFRYAMKDPLSLVFIMVNNPSKIKTILTSFFTFASLPVFSELFILIPLLGDFALRFFYEGPQYTKWLLVNHHAATGAMLLSISSVYACNRLQNYISLSRKNFFICLLSMMLILSAFIQDIILKAPIHSIFKKSFYEEEKWMKDNQKIIEMIPSYVSVASQNNLVPHLTHRESAYRLPYGLNSEYIALDYHDGPNKYAPLSFDEMKKFVDDFILLNNRYTIVAREGDAILLKRNYKTDISKSPYYNKTNYCYYSFEER